MILYHGSNVLIEKINLDQCNPYKDFGQAFYLTADKAQAMDVAHARVGTRDQSADAPVEYELPESAVAEAIANAVAHRDYTSNGSVQVMLFRDRLEVWNRRTKQEQRPSSLGLCLARRRKSVA